jgi:hypothetical protein
MRSLKARKNHIFSMVKDKEEAKYWLQFANVIATLMFSLALFTFAYDSIMSNPQTSATSKIGATFTFSLLGITLMFFVSNAIGLSVEKSGYGFHLITEKKAKIISLILFIVYILAVAAIFLNLGK